MNYYYRTIIIRTIIIELLLSYFTSLGRILSRFLFKKASPLKEFSKYGTDCTKGPALAFAKGDATCGELTGSDQDLAAVCAQYGRNKYGFRFNKLNMISFI